MGSTYDRVIQNLIRAFVETVDPYLLNPLRLIGALARGHLTLECVDSEATFETVDFWETASLLHTFRKEGSVIRDILETLETDDVFYDVGANLGVFTCFAAEVVTAGSVIAFEPHPDNVRRLRRNISRTRGDATVLEYALSDRSGTANLSVDGGRAANQRYSIVSNGEDRSTIPVDSVTGDELIQRESLPQPDVLKIDVEGAEGRVIDGFGSTLVHPGLRVVYCEIHPQLMTDQHETAEGIRRVLRDAGFSIEPMQSRGGQSYVKGIR